MSTSRTAASRFGHRSGPLRRRTKAAIAAFAALAMVLPQTLLAPAAAAADPVISVKYQFNSTAGVNASGYLKDTGAAYNDADGRGWVRQDSLAGTHVPYAIPLNTRYRNATGCLAASFPERQRSLIHMQAPATTTTNDATPAAWEYAVPNGDYQVTVGVGDSQVGNDAESHVLHVEGVTAFNQMPKPGTTGCQTAGINANTVWVRVTDGRLTIDALGGQNTKLNFVTIDSVQIANLVATPFATSIGLDWDDLSGATGYKVWRSTTLPVNTAGATIATPTDSTWTDTTAVKGQVYWYVVAPNTASAGAATGAVMDDGTPAATTFPAKFNFQNNVTPPAGWTGDYGQNYANVRGYGWLDAATGAPLSMITNGRTRTPAAGETAVDPTQMTTIHMQGNTLIGFYGAGATGTPTQGKWQLAVPNGSYDVTVSVGDFQVGTDATSHVINLEGTRVVDNFVPTATTKFQVKTATVQVTDGFLSVDANGGKNTKLNYITVAQTPADAPPAAPTALTATAGDHSVALDWADNTESDIAGYNVFRSTTSTVATTGTPLNGATALTTSAFTDTTAENTTTYYYAVVAVDQGGNKSVASSTVSATPDAASPALAELPIKINFGSETAGNVAGYDKDFGQGFTNSAGRGWVAVGTHTPTSLVNNGRFRDPRAGVPDLQRGLMHMASADIPGSFTGTKTRGDYEIAVADGTYDVTVSAGDQPGSATASCVTPCYDSTHTIKVEGTTAINAFKGTAAKEFDIQTVTVQVTDGRLTFNATGGTNTKINYIIVEPTDLTPPAIPTGATATAGDGTVAVSWTAVTATDLAGYHVYRSTSTPVATSAANRITATPLTATQLADTSVVNGTAYHYVITSIDTKGNESDASTEVDATPADSTAPAAPVGLTVTAGDASATVRWTPSTEGDLTGYRVYRSTTSPVSVEAANLVASPTAAQFDDTGLTNGTTYYYVITALDDAGNQSPASAEKSVEPTPAPDVTAPAAPTGLTATAGDAKVTLQWTANTEDDLAGYTVYRSATPGAAGVEIGTAASTSASYVDATALNTNTYYYVIVARDLAGNVSQQSNEASATPADTTPPAVTTGLVATAGIQSVTLTWAANTEADFRGYRIYRGTSATPASDENNLIGIVLRTAGRTFLDTDLDPGVRVYYQIVSYDTLGNRAAASAAVSAVPTATPDTTAPAAPTGLTATVADGAVSLTWTAVTAGDLAGYSVYRSATAGGARTKLTGTLLTGTTFVDSSATPGTTSYYVVTASDTSNNESVASNQVSAAVPAAGLDVKYVFQTDAAPVPAGWTKDIGAAWTDAAGRGWVRQDTLTSANHTPLDLTANTRLRTRTTVTDLQNRMIHLQYGDIVPLPTGNGTFTPGAWELAVPNGRYTVGVSVGDQPGAAKTGCAAPCYDSKHTIRAEGVTLLNQFQATAANEYGTATATVDVTDGRLTIDALGGNNTKLNWVTVVGAGPIAPDTQAPAAPTGLTGIAGNASSTLTWTPPADLDVVGYHVYGGTGAVVVPGPDTRRNTNLLTGPSFSESGLTNGTTYRYVVTAVDAAGNESPASVSATVTPAAGAGNNFAVKVNFQDAASTPPAGYVDDHGQAFGARTEGDQGTGLTYGWVNIGTNTPLSLEGNGRNRNTASPSANEPDLRLATLVHSQLAPSVTTGVHTPGAWEIAVPNGSYEVTVGVGDAGTAIDSSHWLNIENQNAVAAFVPASGSKYSIASRTVTVTDGRLTLSPAGGTNTKFLYADIAALDRGGRPFTTAVSPGNLATSVVDNTTVTADNSLNADTGAVDETTLGGNNVTLTRVSDGARVAGTGATSGGGDTVSFLPAAPLAAGTLYRFTITSNVKDKSGRAFLPFSSVFTTATTTGGGGGDFSGVAFDKLESGAATGASYTSLVIGPDGKLYAGSIYGQIYRWTINADGTLANRETINTVRTHASTAGWEGAPNRTIIGLAFDPASTADNLILWITDNYAYLGANVPDFTGAVAKLTGPNLENYQEVVVNLPRSIKDHETNSIAFKDGKLYITQGSMNAMGALDGTWKRDEHLLSASVLELDPAKLGALPLDVATPDMGTIPARGGVPAHAGAYNPYAASAPLTLYATGIRNAFDLIWHSNGRLYSGTNGSAAGGATPATPATLPASCANRPDGGYTGPNVPAIGNNQQAETDYLFDVKQGKYYGHPNPVRCEYVLNAGNPAGYTGNPLFKVNAYPLGTPSDPNYDLAGVHDAGLHASANGTIEYKNTVAFGGKLAGAVIVVRYSANQEIVAFSVTGNGGVSDAVTGITGFTGFRQPLDIAQDVTTGNLYVSELTDNPATTGIKLLKPQGGGSAPKAEATPRVVFTEVAGGAASAAKNVSVKNIGGLPLTITGATFSGADAALFARSGGPTLPTTVAPGATVTFPVTFNPTVPGPRGGTLVLATNDPTTPTTSVTLRGLGTIGTGGTNEPSLQWILDTLQIPVNVGDPDPTNNDMPVGNALIGEEVAVTSFTKALFDRVVGITPLSLFGPAGPAGNPNVAIVAAHSTADPSARTVLFNGPNTSNQQVLPEVVTVGEYDLETPFGFDVTFPGLSGRVAYSEDALNTWATGGNNHKIRVYPMKNPDGSLVANAYIIAPEDVPTGVDFQDAAFVVTNVKPAALTGAGKLSVTPSELVFSGVRGNTTAGKPLTVTNTGTTPLNISSVTLTGTNAGSFTLTGGAQSLAVGATATYTVAFKPGAAEVGSLSAAVRFVSDDTASPTTDVGVYGLATTGEQGNNEPPLKAVVDTLGYPINVGGTGLILGVSPTPIGDEVTAPLFVKAGAAPVTMTPVARYSPDELLPFGWYLPNAGDPQTNQVATIALDQEQTLNPAVVAGGGSSFDPGTASFGFYVDSLSFNRKSYTQDGLNTGTPHAVRTYPAKNRAGVLIPNTYLVTFEDASNGDYQDYVFLVTGVTPAGSGGSGTPIARIDFQPATATVATGYTADTGAAFTAARGFGWVTPGTTTPMDMTAQTRDRAGTVDQKLRTVILMQPTATQSPAGPGAWQYAVPNGTYTVTVGVGDSNFTDSVHRVQVEGQTAIANFAPTTADAFRTGTVQVTVTDGFITVDATGGTNTKLTFLDIDRPVTGADTTPPTVSAAVSGLQASAGVYKNKATITVVASDTGSGVAGTSYSLDGGAFLPYTAPVEVTTVGTHTVRARAQDVAGNLATSATTTFSVVAAGASKAVLTLENADGVPYSDRLTMNRIQNPQTGTTCKDAAACDPVTGPFIPANTVHDTTSLVIRNTGTDPLNVTELAVTGPFTLVTPPALPALVAVGGTLTVQVRFTATTIGTSGGLWNGTLTVGSDDPARPSVPVELAGFWQSISEGGQEPDLSELARLFGYTTTITAAGVPLNQQGKVTASGDEVLSPYWLRADASQPVSVRQLAAYHTQGNTATFKWNVKGSNTTTNVLTHAGVDGQSILPHRNGSTTLPASGTFSPTGAFGFQIDGEWSDPVKNNQGVDNANGCVGACGHHLRAWSVRDRSGAVVPNTWLVSMDYSGINYDYQDNVYLVTNIKPEVAVDPTTPLPLPGAAALKLDFATAVATTLVDKDGQGTGFLSTQPNKLDTTVGSDSYKASLLDLVTGTPGTLAVSSSGTATAGTNGSNDNTLANGLQLPFDGSGGAYSVSGRVLGSLAEMNAGSEQQGIMVGTDQDNFVKVAAINKSGVPSIELYAEMGGTGATVGTAVTIPAPGTVTSLDLALLADPAAGTVRGAYRIGTGAWVVMPTAYQVPTASLGRVFGQRTAGGILVSHKGGVAFTATYDSFGITAGDVTAAAAARDALYRLDVAGAGNYTDTLGQVWTPDTGRFGPSTAIAEGATTAPQEIAGTDDDTLYRTYRGNVGNVAQAQRVLTYTLPSKGATKVDVRLHFAERAAANNTAGKRLFDIEVEGAAVRRNFDIYVAAGGQNTATTLTVPNVTVVGGTIDLAFRASVDYPSIAAIEVLCQGSCPPADTTAPAAPTALTGTAGSGGVTLDWADNTEADLAGYRVFRSSSATGTFTAIGTATTSEFTDTSVTTGATVYYQVRAFDSSENESAASATASVTPPLPATIRINTGGPAQTVSGTTWSACSSLTACSNWVSGGNAYSEADTITGIPAGMNNTIFQTEWTGGGSTAVGARAFGFSVPVTNGFYRVRLHFAELNKTAANTRLFDVRLENATVLSNFDIWVQAGGIDKAIVREFTANITDGAVTIDFMKRVENAKISAIEIIPTTAPDTTPPAAVTGVTATGSATGIALAWTASTATDLAGYNVYRASSATGTYTKVNTALLTGTSFSDTAAPQGVASYYQITAVDQTGNESARSATANATRPDTTAPAVVAGVTATGSGTGIALTWTASAATDLAGYNVYRASSATGTYTKVNTALLTGTSFSDTSAPVGVASYYQVTAVDTSANESARSATVNATRPDTTPPGVTTGVAATASTTGITVSWTANPATDLAGYNVYRASSATGTYTKLNTALVTGTSFSDTTAPQGVASYYQVTAVDTSANESARSATVTATRPDTTPPAVVTGVAATGSTTAVALTWGASAATDLAGYNVYRASSATGTYTKVNTALVTGTSFSDTSAPVGTSYYQITAVDNSGNESVRSATVNGTRTTAPTPPPVVTGVAASGAATGNTVTWTASTATGLAGYNVYRSASATGTFTLVNTGLITGTSFSDTGAPVGTSYYQVTAVNTAAQESARSATVQATRPAAPGGGTTVRINAGGGTQNVNGTVWSVCTSVGNCSNRVSGGSAYSEQDTITGIPAGMNNTIFQSEWTGGSGITVGARAFGFSVPVTNGSYRVRLHFAELNKTAANTRTFDVRIENATVLSNFDIWVQAGGIDKAIVREFPVTITDGAVTIDFMKRIENAKISAIEILPVTTPDTTPPGAVTGVAATGAAGGVTVNWATNTASDLAGYNVYRSTSATGTYTKVNTALVTGTSYLDAAAPTGVASYYQVTAVDQTGNESVRSATVNATRPAANRPTIRINAGGGAQSVSGVTWTRCTSVPNCSGWVSGGGAYSQANTITGIPAGMNNAIFQSEWTGGQTYGTPVGARAFGFSVPVENGAYRVRLHFAELNKTGANQRTFDVRLENTTVLTNFDIWAQAAGANKAIVREFQTTVADGEVTIDFIRRIENAKVTAIEIIPVN
ncbi:choice-of-anchor D domain-containing protein [Nakamurella sp. YIM 132087]|uniref:Choice-of-anchor D domain-containing protein n=1 Tax=Nakamurella alba TaxID=2665158 RepID=A0A7K1FS24_9ACTN|nr:malectin domain-containing carbohydrate-binding protein [Nakamurella alba]MTD16945.1 choice-of-anchor D domain-containing protein [Nakamurella alba]